MALPEGMTMALPFTNQVKTLRFLSGEMTQEELGEFVGVTRQTIAAIEQGKYSPSLETAFRIARVFGKGLEDVFMWEEEGPMRPAPDTD
jgi:putative transcriptional regulator